MNKTAGYAKKFINYVPKDVWEKFKNTTNSGFRMLSNANDKDVREFIIKNNLTSSNNLAKFMVRVQIKQVTGIYEGIYSIKKDIKNEWKSKLEHAGDIFEYALDNPKKKNKELNYARRQVMECIRVFVNDVLENIEQIRQIDNQSQLDFIFTSFISSSKCKKEIEFAIDTIQRILNAYELLFIIASNTEDNISSLFKQFDEVQKNIMAKDNCLLMAAYCKSNNDKEFWYGLSNLWEEKRKFFSEGNEVFKDKSNEASSFWDDDSDDIDLENLF